MREAVAVTCPHPECRGVIKVGPDLSPGVYDCICRTIKVRLERADAGPTLALADGCTCPRCDEGGSMEP